MNLQSNDTERIIELLASIAASLAAIAHNTQRELPEEPNLQRPLDQYLTFDWSSIDATIVKSDEYGPAIVECDGRLWTRRSPENKFGEAIWYSRAAGKDEAGVNRYLRLITFRQVADPEPISRAAEKALRSVAAPPAPVVVPSTADEFERLPSASQRPRSPAALKHWITVRAAKQPGPQNDQGRDRARLWAAVSNLCNGDQTKVRQLLNYFFGAGVSTKNLTEGQCKAVTDWINSARQPDNSYLPDPLAVAEYKLLLAELADAAKVSA